MMNKDLEVQKDLSRKIQVSLSMGLLWTICIISLFIFIFNWNQNPITLHFLELHFQNIEFSLGLRLDVISTSLLIMVTLLGALIGRYAYSYLEGEQRKVYFYRYLFVTILSAATLVTSSNLVTLFAAWLVSSLGLHKLLVYYENRTNAKKAALKKFIISRLGDLFILAAITLTYRIFGTFEFDELFSIAKSLNSHSELTPMISLMGLLFALGAMTKSAQFPFHFWLTETMETPTPVSALMHAGIINAGGFLMIRLSPLIQIGTVANTLLAVVGSFTAVYGSLSMITQNDIKKKLAYSTISQMGMMICACGLGAYSLALFHIVMHSFYKAHAFLTTGNLVEESKKLSFKVEKPSFKFLFISSALGASLMICGTLFYDGKYLAYFTYLSILLLGVLQNREPFLNPYSRASVSIRVISLFGIAMGFTYLCEYFLNLQLDRVYDQNKLPITLQQEITCSFVFVIFTAGFWLSAYLVKAETVFFKQLYTYFWNGGYFNSFTDRLLAQVSRKLKLKTLVSKNVVQTTEHANA